MYAEHTGRIRGFTILELTITLFIVTSLVGAATMTARHIHNKAIMGLLQSDMHLIKEAASRFRVDCGFYPPDVARGVDPGLVVRDAWSLGGHSVTWDTLDLSCWKGPYLKEWLNNPWGGLYEWDNFSGQLPGNGVTETGVYLTVKPSAWGGRDGFPNADFEDYLESLGVDCSLAKGVIAVRMGGGDQQASR